MGLIRVTVHLTQLGGGGDPYEADFLVDTGAIHCMAPTDRLAAAGVTPEGKAVYELADGRSVEYPYGFARVTILGAETVTQVTFGPNDSEPLLGVAALENVGIVVNPVDRTLKRLHAIPLK
ncbi:MAG: aspartyl protease family protein [Myxococcota bacterium]|nr:aspartyl protease family protein [Myxococcota bacterium]